jgi:hypothetical protein
MLVPAIYPLGSVITDYSMILTTVGMIRSSFENPLALPGKTSSRSVTEAHSTPAVRQFSAPKAVIE